MNILEETLQGSKQYGSVLSEFKERSEVIKDFTSGLTTVEDSSCGYLFEDDLQLKLPSVTKCRD